MADELHRGVAPDGAGQPVVTALARAPLIYEFAARAADLVFATPTLEAGHEPVLDQVAAAARGGAPGNPCGSTPISSSSSIPAPRRGPAAGPAERTLRRRILLRRRGVLRADHTGATLRDNLGLAPLPSPARTAG